MQSKWVSSMWRPAYDDVIFSTGLEEAITSLSLFYPEGMSEFVKISDFVHNGMSWDEARIAAARLFGLTSLYYQERIRAGKEPLNLIFSDIPGRTRRVKTEKH